MLCAVVALVLLMVLLQSRGALASTTDALGQAERDAEKARADVAAKQGEIDELNHQIAGLEGDIDDANEAADEQRSSLAVKQDELESANSDLDELRVELEEAVVQRQQLEADLTARSAELAVAENVIAQLEATAETADAAQLALTHQNENLQVQLIEAADEAARRSVPSVPSVLVSDDGSDLAVPAFSPAMAWDLELVRSERTWRYSVAANPVEDPSPFANTDNPLRLAIEIEALALREDVGAFIGIDWQAGIDIDPTADPARAHLTLRLAQELLASAARELSPSTLVVTSDDQRGGVSLEVVASDPDDVDFKIPPPPIASEWIGVDQTGGMIVTVRGAD